LRIVSILSNPEEYFGKIGRVGGWVKTTRNADGKTILFIELNDGSCQKNI
jgi:aspartyl/asparaginyl-tRNA synthetase